MDIGSKIKALRKENQLNQQQFAEIFHVTRQTVSNWENNKNYPDMLSLKQISDTFQISFDTLLKDDLELMNQIDLTGKKAVRRKYFIVILSIILCAFAGCFYIFCKAFEPTKDGDRIHTGDQVRMLVNLPDAAPSRAITYSFAVDENENPPEDKLVKLKQKVLGRMEGDIPCIFPSETPEIGLSFQDVYWNNIEPERVIGLTLELKSSSTSETRQVRPEYRCHGGKILLEVTPDLVKTDTDSIDLNTCVITAEYIINGRSYISITGLSIMHCRYTGP